MTVAEEWVGNKETPGKKLQFTENKNKPKSQINKESNKYQNKEVAKLWRKKMEVECFVWGINLTIVVSF